MDFINDTPDFYLTFKSVVTFRKSLYKFTVATEFIKDYVMASGVTQL